MCTCTRARTCRSRSRPCRSCVTPAGRGLFLFFILFLGCVPRLDDQRHVKYCGIPPRGRNCAMFEFLWVVHVVRPACNVARAVSDALPILSFSLAGAICTMERGNGAAKLDHGGIVSRHHCGSQRICTDPFSCVPIDQSPFAHRKIADLGVHHVAYRRPCR